jgi:hypothetical protein
MGALMDVTILLIFVMLVLLLGGGDWVYCRWHARHGRFPSRERFHF